MGPKGHSLISIAVIDAMKPALGNHYDFSTFYLGNWLTDISQFNAPLDFAQAMLPKLKDQQAKNWFVPTGVVNEIAVPVFKDLFGNPPPKGSKLKAFFRELMYLVTCIHFKNDFQNDKYPTFKDIYANFWTQYFPHEHLDRWPADTPGVSERGLAEYLEKDIEYIAELLTKIQKEWRACFASTKKEDVTKRLTLMAEFGHTIHAVEDYFAHSNFVEHAQAVLGKDNRSSEVWLKRFLYSESDAQTKDHVFTGYFDSVDTQFSIHHFYEDYSKKEIGKIVEAALNAESLRRFKKPRYSLLTESEKTDFWKDTKVRSALKNAIRYYVNKEITHTQMKQDVNKAVDTALAIDLDLLNKHGIGPVLILDGLVTQSKAAAHNTAAKRRVGSHTLLSKDHNGKLNFNHGIALAKRVGRYVGEVMSASVKEGCITGCSGAQLQLHRWGNTDWLLLLQHFLCNPRKSKGVVYEGKPAVYEVYVKDYKTKPLDTLASIAASHTDTNGKQLKWEDIADATFGTRDKDEINKILKKWGCKKVRHNYAFIGYEKNNNEIVKIPEQKRLIATAAPAKIADPWYAPVIEKSILTADHHFKYKTCAKNIYNDRAKQKSKQILENYYNSEIPLEVSYFTLEISDKSPQKLSKEQVITIRQEHKYFVNVFSGGAMSSVDCLEGKIGVFIYRFRSTVAKHKQAAILEPKSQKNKYLVEVKKLEPGQLVWKKHEHPEKMFAIVVLGLVKKSRYRIRYITYSKSSYRPF